MSRRCFVQCRRSMLTWDRRMKQWLDMAYQARDVHLEFLKTDFWLDPLRADPRFAQLVSKVGLPHEKSALLKLFMQDA